MGCAQSHGRQSGEPLTQAECRFPDLPERYDRALREAAAYILERWEPLGIIATGTIVRGDPGPASDHDIVVIVPGRHRLRVQKWFSGVPAELFVNAVGWIEHAFETGRHRPDTAHMIATGFVVLDCDPVLEKLRIRAREILEEGPRVDEKLLTRSRYAAVTRVEDAFDLAESDPESAAFLATTAVDEMLRFVLYPAHGRFVPRWKEIFSRMAEVDARAAELARAFYRSSDPAERLRLAGELSDRIVGARGFFEWESDSEELN